MKLFISKIKNLNEKETTVLAVLNGLFSHKNDYLMANIELIAYMLIGKWMNKRNNDRRLYNNIRDGIESLSDRKIITIIDSKDDNYIISKKGLEVDTEKEFFTVVELWELQRIFQESNKPFNVFAFFVNLVGTINSQTKEWHMSQDEMARQWKYGKETVNHMCKSKLKWLSEVKY